MGPVTVVLLTLSIFFFVKEKNKRNSCTQRTVGTVFRYSSSDDIFLPVVEYFVDGKRYTGKRKWRSYKVVQASWIGQSSAKTNTEKNTLSVRGNYSIMNNPIDELYPLGRQLDVFYNPEKPKQSYVEIIDPKPSVIGKVFLFAGIGSAVLTVVFCVLLMYLK